MWGKELLQKYKYGINIKEVESDLKFIISVYIIIH